MKFAPARTPERSKPRLPSRCVMSTQNFEFYIANVNQNRHGDNISGYRPRRMTPPFESAHLRVLISARREPEQSCLQIANR